MVKIVQKGNKILNQIAEPVPPKEIQTPKIQKVIAGMIEAMNSQDDSVAIAAPQIGQALRIFVVSGKSLKHNEHKKDGIAIEGDEQEEEEENIPNMVFINPEIIKQSKKTLWRDEGCLSVRWWYGEVKRYTNTTIRAYNEKGEQVTRGAGGMLAHIFQHEVDHLDGILFDSKARNLREAEPE